MSCMVAALPHFRRFALISCHCGRRLFPFPALFPVVSKSSWKQIKTQKQGVTSCFHVSKLPFGPRLKKGRWKGTLETWKHENMKTYIFNFTAIFQLICFQHGLETNWKHWKQLKTKKPSLPCQQKRPSLLICFLACSVSQILPNNRLLTARPHPR